MPTSFLNPITPNPLHPFPDEAARQQADLAATALINRYTQAQRAMAALPPDADNRTSLAAFHELASIAHEMHRVLMLGWWTEQPF
jgi:hypothetical protein